MIRTVRGKTPKVHPTAFVSEAAYVVGDVEIGEGSSIWPGAVIRGDTGPIRIGKFTNIQDNTVIHTDREAIIGDHVTMGHMVVCHAHRVGDNTLIGNGAVVNEAAEIGDHCIIAANSTLLEGVKIPPNSIARGTPAEAKGAVNERHLEMIERIWKGYHERSRWFVEAGLGDKLPT